MTSVRDAASYYTRLGFWVIPVGTREKAPKLENWPELRLSEGDLDRYFGNGPSNIGVILGEPWGNTDVDVDAHEALAAWPEFAPETGHVHGRKSKPWSHWFYRSDPPLRSMRFLDPCPKEEQTACLIEIRGLKADGTVGQQTVVPPSVHPSGETITFHRAGEPANIDAEMLVIAVSHAAAAALFGRHAPSEGARHLYFLHIAGMLAHAQWALEDATAFVRAIYRVLWGNKADLAAATKEVESTYQRFDDGGETTGIPHLEEILDKKVLKKALEWLAIGRAQKAKPAPEEPQMPAAPELWEVLRDRPVRPYDHLIAGLIVRPGVTMCTGPPKSGKTLLSADILLALATGRHLFDYYTVREPTPTLLVEQDDTQGAASIKEILLKSRRYDPQAPAYFVTNTQFTIGDELFRKWLLEYIGDLKIGLAVLDVYLSLRSPRTNGIDIVKAEEGDLLFLNEISDKTRCGFLLTNHESKSSASLEWSSRGAGTYALWAKPVGQISVGRFAEASEGDPERLVRVRGRHIQGAEMVLRFRPESLDFDLVMDGAASALWPEIRQLRAAFPGTIYFTAKQVGEETGWSRPAVYRTLSRLTFGGVLRKESNTWTWIHPL